MPPCGKLTSCICCVGFLFSFFFFFLFPSALQVSFFIKVLLLFIFLVFGGSDCCGAKLGFIAEVLLLHLSSSCICWKLNLVIFCTLITCSANIMCAFQQGLLSTFQFRAIAASCSWLIWRVKHRKYWVPTFKLLLWFLHPNQSCSLPLWHKH